MGRNGLGKMVLFGRYTFLENMGLGNGRFTQGGFGTTTFQRSLSKEMLRAGHKRCVYSRRTI